MTLNDPEENQLSAFAFPRQIRGIVGAWRGAWGRALNLMKLFPPYEQNNYKLQLRFSCFA